MLDYPGGTVDRGAAVAPAAQVKSQAVFVSYTACVTLPPGNKTRSHRRHYRDSRPLFGETPCRSATHWLDELPQAFQTYRAGRDVDEVECIVPDLAGMSRGKAMP